MRNITLLHISDMQFGKFHRFAEGRDGIPNPHDTLTERLIDDLKHLAEHNQVRPDLIICTGDLAEWGMAKEFSDAFAFLAKLCDHYLLPRSRCIVIPGNHDINRKLCSAYFDECQGNGEKPVFPWFPKWKPFKTAFDKFYEGVPGIAFSESEPWSLFILDDLRVVVAGLNSTMDEGHDAAVNGDDRSEKGHHGLCTERQLQWFKQRLADDRFDGWLRIGAVHHNAIRGCRRDDENLRDADLLGGILGDQLHVLLHGHTHEAKADMLAAKVRVYSTGSASLKTSSETAPVPTDIPNQYQILRLQRTNITRYCRQYAPRNTPPSFIADVRQSRTRGDWIITDPVDLSSVSAIVSETDVADAEEPTKELGNASTLPVPIPMPPAFYAKPDYIGSHKFVGRNSQLQELTDWANPADPTNLLLFEAIGGNGKSMLTWEWTTNPRHALAARPADKPWAGRFWYSFYEGGASMEGFCHHALAYMTGRPLEDFAKKKPTDLKDELLTLLHARPWLLVLDGLERVLVAYHRIDAAEVPDEEANSPTDKIANRNPCDAIRDEDNDLLRALAAAAPSKLLVSSRLTPRVLLNPSGQPIPGAKRITLPGLRPLDAEALLRSCGIQGKSDAIQSYLAANCDNHPLVIGILGGLIANYLPARGDFDVWAAARDGGAALDLASLDLVQRRNHILEAAIQKLPDPSRQLLSTLSLIPDSVAYETLKAFNPHRPLDLKKLQDTVNDLEQRGLLHWDGRTRKYDLHPAVRAVVSGGMTAEDRKRHGQRLVDHFSYVPEPQGDKPATLYIRKLTIENIRCFDRLELNLCTGKEARSLTMLLGDNAVGKTTILRCLALAMCDETSASSLMDDMEGNLLRYGSNEGKITVLCGERETDRDVWKLETRITRGRGDVLLLKQENSSHVPLKRIFTCAYGAFRGGFGTKSYERYEVRDSVRSLFDYTASLQNPELVVRRMEAIGYDVAGVCNQMNKLLMLSEEATQIDASGISVEGPWQGRVPVGAIGDGYAATLAWLVDFFGWALFYEKRFLNSPISGIVILDEIEKHLHPRWQRHIIRQLCEQFPLVQFILTSHSPICAGGVADLNEGKGAIFVLSHDLVASQQIEPPAGWRYDQILTSSAFGLTSARDATTQQIIDKLRSSQDSLHRHADPEKAREEFQRILSLLESRSVTAAQDESDRQNRYQLAEELRKVKSLLEGVK